MSSLPIEQHRQDVREAVDFLGQRLATPPEIAIVLGTGLGGLTEKLRLELALPYADIPHFPRATVAGHAGNLLFGELNGRRVAVLQGRFHYYEGYSTRELTMPVRVLGLLGARCLVVTNAAGGLDTSWHPGTIMIIRDHLNFIGENPLRGPNIDEWGPRFPDLSEPYAGNLIDCTLACAARLKLPDVTSGVYVGIPGPSLETPAETRFLRLCGADAVGMSSVPEVIVARHAGMAVLGLSVVANINDPDDFRPIILEDIVAAAERAGGRLEQLLLEVLPEMTI